MKVRNIVLALVVAAASAAGATSHHAANESLAEGEVRKIDRDAKKITLKHGAIRNLDMPPMTMVFQVKDAALLKSVKPGDKVRFAAEKVAGAYTVTRIEATK
jgi:Cu(I)/Ag(I) efflux system periplasmic protein CusF